MTSRTYKLIASACAGLILLTGAAMASPAQTTNALNVRSGPGTGYRVIDVLKPREWVDVQTCRRNGWCYIRQHGRDGWVSSNYLTDRPYHRERVVPPRGPRWGHRHRDYPRYRHHRGSSAEFTFRFGNGGFRFDSDRDDCYRRGHHIICR